MVWCNGQLSYLSLFYLKARLGFISKALIQGVHLYGAVQTKNIFMYIEKGLRVTLGTPVIDSKCGFNVGADQWKCPLYLICCSNIIAHMFTLQNADSSLSAQITFYCVCNSRM